MPKYQHAMLTRRSKTAKNGRKIYHWVFTNKPNTSLGTNLVTILNKASAAGWEVVCSGDFGAGYSSEVILRK